MTKPKTILLAATLAVTMGMGLWYQYSRNSSAGAPVKQAQRIPVTVATATTSDIPVMLDVVGRAEAYESVTIKSRLDGQVAAVLYTEGQHVKQGDVLLKLDPGDFEARMRQAEATLAKDEAQSAKAKADVARYVALKERGFVSDEKVNEIRTIETAALATAKADNAALDLTRLQVSYATIRAPFDGVVGARLVFPGSSVKTNDTALVVVNRVRPLYVTFSVPEKHLPRLRAAFASAQAQATVTIPGSKEPPFEGVIRFIDNAVDATTGTIQIKALLENREEKLTPGQFLNVSMRLDTLANSVTVPAEAVQQGAEGNFLFVVNPDDKVEPRKIELLTVFRGLAAIGKGLSAGETVVTDGQLRLTPGATVQVKKTGQDSAKDSAKESTSAPAPAAQ